MYPYRNLKKAELIELLDQIEVLSNRSLSEAKAYGEKSANDITGKLAVECGFHTGTLKTISSLIDDYKKL